MEKLVFKMKKLVFQMKIIGLLMKKLVLKKKIIYFYSKKKSSSTSIIFVIFLIFLFLDQFCYFFRVIFFIFWSIFLIRCDSGAWLCQTLQDLNHHVPQWFSLGCERTLGAFGRSHTFWLLSVCKPSLVAGKTMIFVRCKSESGSP